jgi:hypothetical protein
MHLNVLFRLVVVASLPTHFFASYKGITVSVMIDPSSPLFSMFLLINHVAVFFKLIAKHGEFVCRKQKKD